MSHFTTLHDDQFPDRDHEDIDADLGGLDEEMRRHRAIAADVTRGPVERETARTTARTIAHCVYLLRGKTLVGVGIGVVIWLRRFRRTATVVAATTGFSTAAAISGAAIISPATTHDVARPPPASTAPAHHTPAHTAHTGGTRIPAGNDIDQPGPARPAPTTTTTHRQAERSPAAPPIRPTQTTTVGRPPPTVVHNQTTVAPEPTTAPTRPDPTPTPTTEPTAPTSSAPTSLLHLKLPLPVKVTVSGLLDLN